MKGSHGSGLVQARLQLCHVLLILGAKVDLGQLWAAAVGFAVSLGLDLRTPSSDSALEQIHTMPAARKELLPVPQMHASAFFGCIRAQSCTDAPVAALSMLHRQTSPQPLIHVDVLNLTGHGPGVRLRRAACLAVALHHDVIDVRLQGHADVLALPGVKLEDVQHACHRAPSVSSSF